MRILFLALDVNLDLPRGDGVHVAELAQALAAIGNDVLLITATRTVSPLERVRHFPRPDSTLGQVKQAVRLARGWADVIYERRFSPKVSWTASLLTGAPFIVEVNGVLEDELPQATRPKRAFPKLRHHIRSRMIRDAARVVAVSPGIAAHVIHWTGIASERVVTIPNGADTERFGPSDLQSCRNELGIPSDAFVVCFVGNLAPWQGVHVLLDAALRLRGRIRGLVVWIVGDGPEREHLRGRASSMGLDGVVRFVGNVPHHEVTKHIGASDVCVAPFEASRKASPIKVFEYLACQRPVVASRIDDVGAWLESSRLGLVAPPGDAEALAQCIEEIAADPRRAAEMASRGRETVLSERSWRETARRITALLDTIGPRRLSQAELSRSP